MTLFYLMVGIFFLFLPAAIANMVPVLVRPLQFLNIRIDGGMTLRGRALLGTHKTVRGFVFGTLGGMASAGALALCEPWIGELMVYQYSEAPLLAGFLVSFGALFGDAVKSFFKRQLDIASGSPWWGFDQVDWIIGASVFLAFLKTFEVTVYVIAIVVGGLLHPLVNLGAYMLRVRSEPY